MIEGYKRTICKKMMPVSKYLHIAGLLKKCGEMEQMMWLISLMLRLLSVYQMMKPYGIDLVKIYQMNLKHI